MILHGTKRSASGQPVPSSQSRSAHLLPPHTSTYRLANWLAIGDGVGGNGVWRGAPALMILKTREPMAAPPRVGHCPPHRAERRPARRPNTARSIAPCSSSNHNPDTASRNGAPPTTTAAPALASSRGPAASKRRQSRDSGKKPPRSSPASSHLRSRYENASRLVHAPAGTL